MTWTLDKTGKTKLYNRKLVQASRPLMRPWKRCDECNTKSPNLHRVKVGYSIKYLCKVCKPEKSEES